MTKLEPSVTYVVGLGDRHLSNVLFETETCKLVHIDLGRPLDRTVSGFALILKFCAELRKHCHICRHDTGVQQKNSAHSRASSVPVNSGPTRSAAD